MRLLDTFHVQCINCKDGHDKAIISYLQGMGMC